MVEVLEEAVELLCRKTGSMKKYIRNAYDLTWDDRRYGWKFGLRDGDIKELARVLSDYPAGVYITLDTKTYSGHIYSGTVEILDDGCLITLTFKGRSEPQKQLNFLKSADELRRLYLFAQGRRGTSFEIKIKDSKDESGYSDVFYV
jgi:hypothetical protein